MTNEEEFDSFIIGSFLDLYHIMESRMEAEEERGIKDTIMDKKAAVGTGLKAGGHSDANNGMDQRQVAHVNNSD